MSTRILTALAHERRVVAADWRFQIVGGRLALAAGQAAPTRGKVSQRLRALQAAGDVEQVEGLAGVYRVTVPYASVLSASEEAILQEANPLAVFSHFTAAQYHNLTYVLPNEFHLTHYPNSTGRLPLGTTPEDWVDIPPPRARTPRTLRGLRVHWHKAKAEWDFGHEIGYVQSCPIYITNVERTLIDALRFPEACGGPLEVMRIWKRGLDALDLDVLVDYIERFDQTLLRQRAGYFLEQLGRTHARFDPWAANSVRGSSARLFASLEFAPTFSERWNLSINAPDATLVAADEM